MGRARLGREPQLVQRRGDRRPGKFAAEEIRREAAAKGLTVGAEAKATRIALTVEKTNGAAAQSYRVRVQQEGGLRTITVRAADAAGAMYGGLDIAEAIRTGTLDSLKDSDHQPHIAQRGIKFNLPLDLRTPNYSDSADAAQANIPEVWERAFWTDYLDTLARNRYNVLSLWSLHPFPSLVKVPEFPEVALNDVWRTRVKLDDTFHFWGTDMVRPAMLADHEVVKRITIDEKIEFWRWVMQQAADRGIRTYVFTWNVFTFGADGKHGITTDLNNEVTKRWLLDSERSGGLHPWSVHPRDDCPPKTANRASISTRNPPFRRSRSAPQVPSIIRPSRHLKIDSFTANSSNGHHAPPLKPLLPANPVSERPPPQNRMVAVIARNRANVTPQRSTKGVSSE
jgi:hypothetical protein